MSTYLRTIPRTIESEPPARAVTVVSSDSRDVVYLDQSASIEIITEALRAWGLRVRAEREGSAKNTAATSAAPAEANWETTRPNGKAPTRLDNVLSPLWLPILERAAAPSEPVTAWSWFTRAA